MAREGSEIMSCERPYLESIDVLTTLESRPLHGRVSVTMICRDRKETMLLRCQAGGYCIKVVLSVFNFPTTNEHLTTKRG